MNFTGKRNVLIHVGAIYVLYLKNNKKKKIADGDATERRALFSTYRGHAP